MKKKVLALLLALVVMLGIVPTASANDVTVILNGEELIFADQKPIILNGRTMVPFRAIFEALGCTVEWDGELRGVYGTYTDGEYSRIISMFIDNPVVMWSDAVAGEIPAVISDFGNVLDVAPGIMNSRTLVPLRAVSEMLGATVEWDGDTYTVTILSGKPFERYKSISQAEITALIEKDMLGTEEFTVNRDPNLTPMEMNAYLNEIVEKGNLGEDFSTLAALYGEAGGVEKNVFVKGSRDADLEEKVEALLDGGVCAVLLSDGYHIVKRVAVSPADHQAKAAAIRYLMSK